MSLLAKTALGSGWQIPESTLGIFLVLVGSRHDLGALVFHADSGTSSNDKGVGPCHSLIG